MATLVLSVVGNIVGGPIGSAVGAIVGQQIDAMIFAPKPRHGPRLGDFAVQTSSYGSPIPKLFGTMRVAGTVIWATDLRETRSSGGGGKGQPKTISYTYSASFAVALSGRPIRAVRRIWADGKLLRGAAGDFKSATGFRLHHGGEDQMPDPLIAAAEGIGQAPAFRGIAYALFEDFQLADYGNRIPSLSFEIEADDGAVTIGAVAEALSGGAVIDGGTARLGGYAASGDSIRSAVEALADIVPLSLIDQDGVLRIGTPGAGPVAAVARAEEGAAAGRTGGPSETARRAAGAVPGEVTIAYHDVARDYQTGLQRAALAGPSLRSDRRALPAALDAGAAKALAEHRLAMLWSGRHSARINLGWRRTGLRPGALLRLEGRAGLWRVKRWTLQAMVLRLELARIAQGAPPPGVEASPGRPIGHPDLRHGPTRLRLHDLALAEDGEEARPLLFAFAAGAEPGWRRAELTASLDGGARWQAAWTTGAPAVMGTALTALAPAGSALFDDHGAIEIMLLSDAMWLEGRADAALANGANLALLGDELIQFGTAEALGGGRFRLSRLLRGRRGTEWAASVHQPGEDFVLIAPEAMTAIPVPLSAIGGEALLMASGLDDAEPALAARRISGEVLRPPAPVHLRASEQPNGDLRIGWVRRSRQGWAWPSGADTPLGEESELYRLMLSGPGFERALSLDRPEFLYAADQRAADGTSGPIHIRVEQIGTFAASRPAVLVIG